MSNSKAMQNYLRYLETYSGKQLLEKHSLNTVGIWEICGEDSNCNLGGSHFQPRLCIVQGKLQDIIMFGTNMTGFWQWGAGGCFNFIGESIPTVDAQTTVVREALEKEEAELVQKLEKVRKQLKMD